MDNKHEIQVIKRRLDRLEGRTSPAAQVVNAAHDILSTTHVDSDATDTPNDGDGLIYDAASLKWVASPSTSHADFTWFESGTLGVWASKDRWYPSADITVSGVRASVDTPPTGSSIKVDVNKNGTTIFTDQSHRPEILANTHTALASGVDSADLSVGDYLTFDIDQVGSTVTGSDLAVTLEYVVTPHSASASSSYASTVLADSPVVYLKLDETTGTTAIDYSGNGYNGTYNGSVTLGVAGPLSSADNKGASFNEVSTGQAAYVSIPAFPLNTNKATVEMWVKNVGGSNGELVADLGTGTSKLQMIRDYLAGGTGRRIVDRGNAGGAFTDTSPVAGGSGWEHWIFTVDRSTAYIDDWLNAVQHHNTGDANTGNFWTSDTGLLMKNHDLSGAVYCIGAIAHFAVYNYVLSSAQIAAHYAAR